MPSKFVKQVADKINVDLPKKSGKPTPRKNRQQLLSPKASSICSSSTNSSKQQKKVQEDSLASLNNILRVKKSKNRNQFSFSDYLHILKQLKLVSNSLNNKKEQNLVTKSWHMLSYFKNGNIVTNSDNIKVFVSGILGVIDHSIFRTVSTPNSTTNISKRGNKTLRPYSTPEYSEGEEDSKKFKFKNHAQVKEIQNMYMPFKLRKFENEIGNKAKWFSYSDWSDSNKQVDAFREEHETTKDLKKCNTADLVPVSNIKLMKKEIEVKELMVGDRYHLKKRKTPCKSKPSEITEVSITLLEQNEKSQKISKQSQEKKRTVPGKMGKSSLYPHVPQMNKCEPPALELDVYISEDSMEKLIVYKQDSPEQVAKAFWIKHNLPNEKWDLLVNVIREQVSKVLTCISEEDEDYPDHL